MGGASATGNMGTFVGKNPLAERIGFASGVQGFLEAVSLRLSQRLGEERGGVLWPHVRIEVNNAMHLVAPGATFVVALEDTEVPIKDEDIALLLRETVRVSVHPPEFQSLVFRTGRITVELQQQIAGFVEALLEVCLIMILYVVWLRSM